MLFILTGLPYSGKTTMRNKLVELFRINTISIDEIMEREGMWRENHPTQEDWDNAYFEAFDTLKKYLNEGENVLFDGGCLKLSERNTLRLIAKESNTLSQLIYLKTSREEIIRRRTRNEETHERGQLNEDTLKDAFDTFEEPDISENPLVYDGSILLDTWVRENIFLSSEGRVNNMS